MQVPTAWQGISNQPQIPATPQQLPAPGSALQQTGIVFPIQQYQVRPNKLIQLLFDLVTIFVLL